MPSAHEEPEVIFPDGSAPKRPPSFKGLILVALVFVGFLFVHNAVPLYTDWLWFGEVGYRNVFTTTILAKTTLFVLFGLLFFVLFHGNLKIARRLSHDAADKMLMEKFGTGFGKMFKRGIGLALLGISGFFSLWAGRLAAESWTQWLEFTHGVPFGVQDPLFHHDVSFYIFQLPFLNFVYSFLFGTLLLTLIAVVAIHILDRVVEAMSGLPDIRPGVRTQFLVLLAALASTYAFGTYLSAFDLLNNNNGVFTGAGYADIHYRLSAIWAEVFFLVLTALSCLYGVFQKGKPEKEGEGLNAFPFTLFPKPALVCAGLWLVSLAVLGSAVPSIGQKVYVEPNQFRMEEEFIKKNIAFTRQGFGLEKVQQVDNFAADESLSPAQLKANQDTLDNVRLWDHPFLGSVYSQLQTVQTYYKFEYTDTDGSNIYNIDIDRYPIGGKPRQVMLAARELDSNSLSSEAQTWQNKRLAYTHGYGVVMSPVNKIKQGGPDYFLQGIPPVASLEVPDLKVSRPEIYYGQLAHEYVFVDTEQQEFDYPSTTGNTGGSLQGHYTTYQGKGGIRIGDAPLAKLAFSFRLGDANILLAKGFKASTRVLFRRDIRERLQLVAPFIQQDSDPYLVINPDDGRLIWIIDGYTLSDRYPYSTPQPIGVNPVTYVEPNYMRNSVKATIDAYEGTIKLYISDPNDPIVKTYASIFPNLLQPLSAMPKGLRGHLRYPEDLFRLQRSVYALYHVDDPRVFYLKEDAWAIPTEPNTTPNNPNATTTPAGNDSRQMEPYYVIMRLPNLGNSEGKGKATAPSPEEFLLMSPLSPIKKERQNILGWMCARCDGDKYGQLVLFRFPQGKSVNGPSQVISLVNSDPVISSQLSLLRQGGSDAKFGNILVIPIEQSLLYIAPLYVESTTAAKLPQLQRVVVALGNRVAMEETFEKALSKLFTGYETSPTAETPNGETPPKPGTTAGVPPTLRTLIDRASQQYTAAQERLKAGDFAGYGTATKELEKTLKELQKGVR